VKQDFEALCPKIRLDIIDLSNNYYDSKSADFIGTTKADVYELDSVFLSDFVASNHIQELPKELQPAPSDFLANAVKGAQLDGKWYGIPHWVCGDFLFYLKDDAPLQSAKTLADLEKAIGSTHPAGKGLFIDMKGSSTLGELYLKSAFDRYADWSHVTPHMQTFDNDLQSDLKRVRALCDAGFCRQRPYHDATGFYGRLFARRKSRAVVGYSELLYDILLESSTSCAVEEKCVSDADLDVVPLPLDDHGAQPMSWVDSLTIDKDCNVGCQQDAALFIKFYTSEESLLKALMSTPARYLLPARASLYQNTALLQHAPLYQKLKPLIEQAVAPTAVGLNDRLRSFGKTVDGNLP
jgi:thiamine pyridinylase